MLTEPNSLMGNVTGAYQRFYNTGWQTVVQRFNQGEITIPAGQSWQTVLGQQVDQYARGALLNYLDNEGIQEGPGGQVLVNRQLLDPSGSGNYRIPDVQIPSASLILDGTIGSKNLLTPQIQDFIPYREGRSISFLLQFYLVSILLQFYLVTIRRASGTHESSNKQFLSQSYKLHYLRKAGGS